MLTDTTYRIACDPSHIVDVSSQHGHLLDLIATPVTLFQGWLQHTALHVERAVPCSNHPEKAVNCSDHIERAVPCGNHFERSMPCSDHLERVASCSDHPESCAVGASRRALPIMQHKRKSRPSARVATPPGGRRSAAATPPSRRMGRLPLEARPSGGRRSSRQVKRRPASTPLLYVV